MKWLKGNVKLFAISFVSLFLELLVIRLIGTEIRIFAYLSNLVLLAAFVGLGLGMMIKKRFSIITSASGLFLIVVATSSYYIVRWPNLEFRFVPGITELLAPLSEAYIWFQPDTYSKIGIILGFFLLFALFATIMFVFIPLGQILGALLSAHKRPIQAYSINIAASLLGMWMFQLFSLARFTPYFGILIMLVFFLIFVKNQQEKLFLLTIIAVTIAFIVPKSQTDTREFWSPYQKLSLSLIKNNPSNLKPQPEGFYLEVNNVGYMSLLNLSKEYHESAAATMKAFQNDSSPIDSRFSDQYFLPFRFKPDFKKVLIIGAGAGNDAAAAARAGEEFPAGSGEPTIGAIEIDPTIAEIGKNYHNEEPYSKSNVNVIVDDGRSFIQRTKEKYDIIIMGLADSHTLSSSLTNLRLDHYLYTKESLAQMKKILTDDGILFLTFEVTRPWIGQRIKRSLLDSFGQDPKIFEVKSDGVYGWGGVFFVVSKKPETLKMILRENKDLNAFIVKNQRIFDANINQLTDDWPYLYLDKPRLPLIHLLVAIVLSSAAFTFRKKLIGTTSLNWPCFFWGAAFLLFEFQNVSKSSLLFGTTWVTNLFTITSILLLLLFANWSVQKRLIPQNVAFVLLIVTLILQILIPLRIFNNLFFWQKVILGGFVLNSPLYFGGIIFTDMFAKSRNKAYAFGSNFLGAVFGGFAEMVSFLTGIQGLIYFVILLYVAGFMFLKYAKNNL